MATAPASGTIEWGRSDGRACKPEMRTRRPKNRWQRRRAGERRGRLAHAREPEQKRRLLRFGPGLALALIASVVVWRASPGRFRSPRPLAPSPATSPTSAFGEVP